MSGFQLYLFRSVLRTLLAIVGGLALIALLREGLAQIDLIVENHQSVLVYLWVSVLAAPMIVSLLLPIAMFIAACAALNSAHRDNEIVVAQAAGLSNWGVAAPVLRLATFAAILHLCLNLWIQPAAYREMRETVSTASSDLASSLVRQGAFTQNTDGLTTFARRVEGRQMYDLLVSDTRNPQDSVTYIAKSGVIAENEGSPVLIMRDGHAEQISETGSLETLAFDQTTFDLAPFVNDERAIILKESDRYLPELFFPDLANYYDNANQDRLLAEGHARISAPLLNIAMALIAIYAVLGGDFNRRGYIMRITAASAAAIALRLLAFGATPAAQDDPSLNALQYAVPIFAVMVISYLFFFRPSLRRRLRRIRTSPAIRLPATQASRRPRPAGSGA